jgi:hypothetical protein
MPSPGASMLASQIAPLTFTVEGGFETTLQSGWHTASRIASAMDTGWTCASPVTPSTMTGSFASEFADIRSSIGPGYLHAIGIGIDAEIQQWVASWQHEPHIHAYAPSASAIYRQIMAASPWDSAAIRALSQRVADVFIANFVQEVG